MLQKYSMPEQAQIEDSGLALTPAFFIDLLKRRLLYFLIPLVVVGAAGITIVMMLPAIYLAEGKILVESQQIPSDFVRPTVTALANERIQVIQQRIMTRDNLLGIANKHQLFTGRRQQMSATERVDFIRSRAKIEPLITRVSSRPNAVAIAFTVGFEHEQPVLAMRVANEFLTMILSEDVRVRTNFAAETTKFLEREGKRIETELYNVQLKIVELKRQNVRSSDEQGNARLIALKAELVEKATRYSESHPDMKAIKQKLAALERPGSVTKDGQAKDADPKESPEFILEALERQEDALTKNLVATNQKLTAARLGETLERGQQSERLEVIEQPSMPQEPVRPKRAKLLGAAVAAAFAAGGGLVVALEMLQSTIYRAADILRVTNSSLLVTIPYIATKDEVLRRRRKLIAIIGISAITVLLVVAAVLMLLPPLDVLLNKLFIALAI